jgi:hypothetical protein
MCYSYRSAGSSPAHSIPAPAEWNLLGAQGDEDAALETPLLHDADRDTDDAESAPRGPEMSFLQKIGTIFATEGAPVFFFMAILMGAARSDTHST